jgi:hypothetical protein
MEKLVETPGITRLSKSQVSVMAADLDAQVEAFRTRPLDAGPYTFVAADALVLKVREGGRVVNVHAMVATGVNADGHREVLGIQASSAEDGAGWLGRDEAPSMAGLHDSPAAAGMDISAATFIEPADWPKIVTFRGSPPNSAMLWRTHSRASTRSSIPAFAEALIDGIRIKPSAPSRCVTATTTTFSRSASL